MLSLIRKLVDVCIGDQTKNGPVSFKSLFNFEDQLFWGQLEFIDILMRKSILSYYQIKCSRSLVQVSLHCAMVEGYLLSTMADPVCPTHMFSPLQSVKYLWGYQNHYSINSWFQCRTATMVVEMSPMMLINFSIIGAFQMIPVFLLILLVLVLIQKKRGTSFCAPLRPHLRSIAKIGKLFFLTSRWNQSYLSFQIKITDVVYSPFMHWHRRVKTK